MDSMKETIRLLEIVEAADMNAIEAKFEAHRAKWCAIVAVALSAINSGLLLITVEVVRNAVG